MSNLFIALGGTGCKAVSKLQQDFKRYYKSKSDPNHYLYIDTDQISIDWITNNSHTKTINLGTFKPIAHYAQSKDQIKRWFDTDAIALPTTTLEAGAKGHRQLSRMGFYYDTQVINDINSILSSFHADHAAALNANQNSLDILKVYVVSGTAGGTGSGIFTDLLYILWRYFATQQGAQGNLDITAILLMPNMFFETNDPELQIRYRHNGYAFLEEINALMRYSQHNDNNDLFFNFVPAVGHRTYGNINKRWVPFSKAILIDNITPNFKIDHNDVYEIIANFLLTYTIGKTSKDRVTINDKDSITVGEALESALTNSIVGNRNSQYPGIFNSMGLLVTKVAYDEFHQFAEEQLQIDLLSPISTKKDENEIRRVTNDLNKIFAEKLNKVESSLLDYSNLKFEKSEKEELKQLLATLDFGKNVSNSKGEGALSTFAENLRLIKKVLDEQVNELRDTLYTFHEAELINGCSLQTLIDAYNNLDQDYYNKYNQEIQSTIDEKKDITKQLNEIVLNKLKVQFYYILSKGDVRHNDKGYLDIAEAYLRGIQKEVETLISQHKDKQEELITKLNNLRNNQIIKLLPEINSVLHEDSSGVSHFDPDGTFYKWYNNLNFNLPELQKKYLTEVFEQNKKHTPEKNQIGGFKAQLDKLLRENIIIAFNDNSKYGDLRNKDLQTIMSDENCENALNHIKYFDYCFLQTQNPNDLTTGKEAYAGSFRGNQQLKKELGCEDNMNRLSIDDVFFKDRIIKVVFKNKICVDRYFKFPELKGVFNTEFTLPKQKDPTCDVPSPFIHKDFCGEKFDADVYSVLTSISNINSSGKFQNLDEKLKQYIVKCGLVFMAEYCKVGQDCKIFKDKFDASFVSYDEGSKIVKIKKIFYDDFLDKYVIQQESIPFDIKDSINIQGQQDLWKESVDFIIGSHKLSSSGGTMTMSDNDAIKCLDKAYEEISASLGNFDAFRSFLKGFVDRKNKTMKEDFLNYLSTSLSK